MKLLNRSALSVRPTQTFVDWINALEPTMGDDDLTLDDVERESTVYLIPEMDTPEALETFVRERHVEILETELRAWEEDERQWPEKLDWSLFQEFLRVEHSYLAIDLDDETALEISDVDDALLLDNVAVAPWAQGRGYGRRLLDAAEQVARAQRYERIRLYTHVKMTENIAIYAGRGYRETGRTEVNGLHRVYMEKTLA